MALPEDSDIDKLGDAPSVFSATTKKVEVNRGKKKDKRPPKRAAPPRQQPSVEVVMETPSEGSKWGAKDQVGRSAKFPKVISESEEELMDTDDDEGDGPSGPLSRRLQHPTDDQMDLSQGLEASAFAGKPATTGVNTTEPTKVA